MAGVPGLVSSTKGLDWILEEWKVSCEKAPGHGQPHLWVSGLESSLRSAARLLEEHWVTSLHQVLSHIEMPGDGEDGRPRPHPHPGWAPPHWPGRTSDSAREAPTCCPSPRHPLLPVASLPSRSSRPRSSSCLGGREGAGLGQCQGRGFFLGRRGRVKVGGIWPLAETLKGGVGGLSHQRIRISLHSSHLSYRKTLSPSRWSPISERVFLSHGTSPGTQDSVTLSQVPTSALEAFLKHHLPSGFCSSHQARSMEGPCHHQGLQRKGKNFCSLIKMTADKKSLGSEPRHQALKRSGQPH